LNPQVAHRYRRRAVIEPFAQDLKADAIDGTLDVAEGFSERVGAIIAVEVTERFHPALYQLAYGLGLQGAVTDRLPVR